MPSKIAQTVQIQIILHMYKISRLCSSSIFYTFQWFCKRTVKAQISLHRCAGWSGPSLSAHAQRHVFTWHSPYSENIVPQKRGGGVMINLLFLYENSMLWHSLKVWVESNNYPQGFHDEKYNHLIWGLCNKFALHWCDLMLYSDCFQIFFFFFFQKIRLDTETIHMKC